MGRAPCGTQHDNVGGQTTGMFIYAEVKMKEGYSGSPGPFPLERCTQDRTAPTAPAFGQAFGHAFGHAFRAVGRRSVGSAGSAGSTGSAGSASSAGSAGSAGILSPRGAGIGMRASARLSVARKRACCRRRHSLGGAGGRALPALASLTIEARCSLQAVRADDHVTTRRFTALPLYRLPRTTHHPTTHHPTLLLTTDLVSRVEEVAALVL